MIKERPGKILKKRYGLDRVAYEIEGLILNSVFLKNRLFLSYMGLPEGSRDSFKKQIARVIRQHMFDKRFYEALAQESIRVKEGENGEEILEYRVGNPLFKWVLSTVYGGNIRKMIQELRKYLP